MHIANQKEILLKKILVLIVLTKPIIHSMLFVVGKIVFMLMQTAVQNLFILSSDAVDCYAYGVPARSINVSGMIIDKGNPKHFE